MVRRSPLPIRFFLVLRNPQQRGFDVRKLRGSHARDAATASFLTGGAARSAYWAIRSNVQGAPSAKATLERALALLERVEASEWRVRQLLNERVP